MDLGFFKLGAVSFQVSDAVVELFVDDDLLAVGVTVETVEQTVHVDGLTPAWAPKLAIDCLFSLECGQRKLDDVGSRRVSWTESDSESPGSIRLYESEPILSADVELSVGRRRASLRLSGIADLHCGSGFDRDTPVVADCRLSRIVFFAGTLPESSARRELGRFVDQSEFAFAEADGLTCLELVL